MTNKKATWPIEITRSTRRRKTVSAELKNGVLVVRAPANMSEAELQPIVEKLQTRMQRRLRQGLLSDEALAARAQALNEKYVNGRLQWRSIRFVTNQNARFGSCPPTKGTIRISHRVTKMPDWVLDYVMVHELAHLEETNHGLGIGESVSIDRTSQRISDGCGIGRCVG